jgi:hypothetical protein
MFVSLSEASGSRAASRKKSIHACSTFLRNVGPYTWSRFESCGQQNSRWGGHEEPAMIL